MKRFLFVCFVAFVVRAVPFGAGAGVRAHVMQSPDCLEYEQAAVNLLDHGTLSIAKSAPVDPDSFRTPGYPALIAAVYALAGRSPQLVVGLQLGLAAVACALLGVWGSEIVVARAAWIGAVVWALDVGSAANATILLSETLCFLLVMAAYFALVPIWRGGTSMRRMGAAGGLLGLAALVRPAVLYWVPVIAVPIAVKTGKRGGIGLGAMVIGFMLVCAPWIARNAVETGVAEFSELEGQNLLFYRASGAMARVWGVSLDVAWKRLEDEAKGELARRGWPRARYGQLCKELAVGYLVRHPLAYAPVLAGGIAKAWLGLSIYDLLKHFGLDPHGLGLFEKGLAGVPERVAALSGIERAAVAVDLATRALALVLGVAGLAVLWRRRAWLALAVIVPPFVYVSLTAGTVVSYYRFRLPAVPFWSLAVGVALDALVDRARQRTREPV